MAIKDQCSRCRNFMNGVCTIMTPVYDYTSCEHYNKGGSSINLQKKDDITAPVPAPSPSQSPSPSPSPSPSSGQTSGNTAPGFIDNSGMFRRIFSFEGRIRRLEYFLAMFVLAILLELSEALFLEDAPGIYLILVLGILYTELAEKAKRCHDLGNSGWCCLIPFYGIILLFAEGDKGINQYGTDPKL